MYNLDSTVSAVAEWYYIGHYGQLGPLTREQVDELIEGGVIGRETYVWKTGYPDWQPAEKVADLRMLFSVPEQFSVPPPPPSARPTTVAPMPTAMGGWRSDTLAPSPSQLPLYGSVPSDRNRVVAGILNLLLPGVGRIYLGYAAHGVLQLVLSFCFGLGYLWSFVDGIIMLSGGVKYDGYGRVLSD